ncbi:MAG: hypothetical protein ACP5F1_00025 [Thermoplasmata archaeon]|nr:hypothetical protein [Thermoplasmata archaeon]
MALNTEYNLKISAEIDLRNLNTERIFEHSKFVKKITKNGETYEIVFSWKKFSITKEFSVLIREYKNNNSILLESTKDSKYYFRLLITSTETINNNDIISSVSSSAEMGAGILADLFGEKDFNNFIKEIVSWSVKNYCILTYNKMTIEKSLEIVKRNSINDLNIMELENLFPYSLLEKIANNQWEEANQEITCLMSKNIENLNFWILKAYICDKCNLDKLSEIYLNYVISKDKNVINGKVAKTLAKDFKKLSELQNLVI